MDLTAFLDFDPSNQEDLQLFLDSNERAHEIEFTSLLSLGVAIPHYPLYTDSPDDEWAFTHDREHRTMAIALGLATPPDLSEVDFEDEESSEEWLANHRNAHALIDSALGV